MYGKIYPSMFTGSMCGSGALVFAVFTYAITNARPDCGSIVSLNPSALCGIIGEDPDAIEEAIQELCRPDPKSRTTAEQGRRIVRIGSSMDYRVVNLEKYRFLDTEDQKGYWREIKRKQREKEAHKQLNDKDCLGHVRDIPGHVSKCPHADADTNADANTKGKENIPLISSTERISLEKDRERLAIRLDILRKQDFRTGEDRAELCRIKERIGKIDTALHIPL